MMRKARHHVGFLEAVCGSALSPSRYNGDAHDQDRITLMQADA